MTSRPLTRRDFLVGAGAAAAGLSFLSPLSKALAAAASAPAARRPNIIVILGDDVGLGDIHCSGGDMFKTPNIDALAQGGTRFEYCFAAPLCGPSRCQLLTGRYPFRTGMVNNIAMKTINLDNEVLIPRTLKTAGYVTASVGKWVQLPKQPGDFGFDEYLRFELSGRYWSTPKAPETYTIDGAVHQLEPNRYLPDVMHEYLVDFMTRHKDQPFYVHYSMSHMHALLMPTPDSPEGSKDIYADNIAYMDKLVGKLMAELDRLKLRENTIVIYVGDNGTAENIVERAGKEVGRKRVTVNGRELSGSKGTMLEGGSRVPMMVSWPGQTPAGKVSQDMVHFVDFYPTLAELAGAELPKGVTLDGQSFAPQIKGQAGKPRDCVYIEMREDKPNGKFNRYARSRRWKLTGDGELFDMKDAPYTELPVPADTTDAAAIAGRKELQIALDNVLAQAASQPAPATAPSSQPAAGPKAAAKKARGG